MRLGCEARVRKSFGWLATQRDRGPGEVPCALAPQVHVVTEIRVTEMHALCECKAQLCDLVFLALVRSYSSGLSRKDHQIAFNYQNCEMAHFKSEWDQENQVDGTLAGRCWAHDATSRPKFSSWLHCEAC
jgi:hypothetical protein